MGKVNLTGNVYTIEKGSNLWNVAKANLQQDPNATVNNTAIINEMNRLAAINGCQNYSELSQKFSRVGVQINVSTTNNQRLLNSYRNTLNRNNLINLNTASIRDSFNAYSRNPEFINSDSSRRDSTRTVRPDSTRVVRPDSTRVVRPDSTSVVRHDSTNVNVKRKPRRSFLSGLFKSVGNLFKPKKERLAERINKLNTPKEKIIEWSKQNQTKNYVIVDKKNCTATVFNPKGEPLKGFEVGLGKDVGDAATQAYIPGNPQRTEAGEYEIIVNRNHSSSSLATFGTNIFTLKATTKVNQSYYYERYGRSGYAYGHPALHQIPNNALETRSRAFGNEDLSDNRMSMGCVNFRPEDFDELERVLNASGGTKVYILPEEDGNDLRLTLNPTTGQYNFRQTKYS